MTPLIGCPSCEKSTGSEVTTCPFCGATVARMVAAAASRPPTLNVVNRGAGWSVLRDGVPVQEGGSSGVHITKGAAVRYAREIAARTGEPLEVEGGEEDIDD